MDHRTYCLISGAVFGIVAVAHLLRLLNHWDVILGPWTVPMWASLGGLIVAGTLSVWALKLTKG